MSELGRWAFVAFCALFANYVPSLRAEARQPVVDVGYARYRGNLTYPDSVAYLGIPYAEPPLGDLRFRSPLPLNVTRVREQAHGREVDATEYPDPCIQFSPRGMCYVHYHETSRVMLLIGFTVGNADVVGNEDCLRVNIYAPLNATPSSKRMFTILLTFSLLK